MTKKTFRGNLKAYVKLNEELAARLLRTLVQDTSRWGAVGIL